MYFFKRLKLYFSTFIKLGYTFCQMLLGTWRISKLKMPMITIFGSHSLKPDNQYSIKAQNLSHLLAESDISVLTGGGGGIMDAASKGAVIKMKGKLTKSSIGIGIELPEQEKSQYVTEYFSLNYFFARKYLLMQFSIGFIFFPGGFGTMDEFFELLTQVITNKIPKAPIVLIGTEFWEPFMQWLETKWITHNVIEKEELDFFYITDDIYRAYSLVCVACKINPKL